MSWDVDISVDAPVVRKLHVLDDLVWMQNLC